MDMKKAFITGASGQDAYYLTELLINKGYEVHLGHRRAATANLGRLDDLISKVKIVDFDLLEQNNITQVIKQGQYDEFYNLAAMSFVKTSFTQPAMTSLVDGMGVLYILEAIRHYSPQTRFYQASTSEMFGKVQETPQKESTPFYPRSPYGVAKLYAHCMTINYRESYNLHACCGILFNHESPKRGNEFVTQKIAKYVQGWLPAIQDRPLELGNLDAKRDWGYAGDYVEAMWLMLQQDEPDDYVIATGETHTVREFVTKAFAAKGFKIEWQGEGENEIGLINGQIVVKVNPDFYRPAEVELLLGDATKAKQKLGWEPKTSFDQLVEMMVNGL